MAVIYQDTPPQYFPQPFQNNSVNVIGYYVTVSEDGTTSIFRKGKNSLNQEETVSIGTINKGENYKNTSNASREEIQYFSANGRKVITEQAVPVVRRGIGGQAGGGNTKINEILGTNLQTPPNTLEPGSNSQQDPTKNKFDLFDDGNRASVPDAEGQRNNYNNPKGGAWIYPTALRTNGQDYIKFEIIKYEPRQFKLNAQTGAILDKRSPQKTPMGTICLPIQPSVTDNNTVDWNGLGVNPLELGVADFSMQIANGTGGQQFDNIMEYLSEQMKNDSGMQNAIKLALAQRAASTSGLLSRVTGAVVNPNLELLFQGPQLRPFNFSFRLSPRNTDEARVVKGIIRAFKEAMAVKVASSELFLKAPNVFNIKYIRGRSTDRNGRIIDEIDPHPSINKIKTCALQACNVDYTPDGTYMTFADSSATMTSYNISLQFQELEPVTSKDYDTNYESIGY